MLKNQHFYRMPLSRIQITGNSKYQIKVIANDYTTYSNTSRIIAEIIHLSSENIPTPVQG